MTHCTCACRHLSRCFLEAKADFHGSEDNAMYIVFQDGCFDIPWKGSWRDNFTEWLSGTYSYTGARKICRLLHACQCCERHQMNKPDPFG